MLLSLPCNVIKAGVKSVRWTCVFNLPCLPYSPNNQCVLSSDRSALSLTFKGSTTNHLLEVINVNDWFMVTWGPQLRETSEWLSSRCRWTASYPAAAGICFLLKQLHCSITPQLSLSPHKVGCIILKPFPKHSVTLTQSTPHLLTVALPMADYITLKAPFVLSVDASTRVSTLFQNNTHTPAWQQL